MRLWSCHFEAVEVPEAPRGDQESHKKLHEQDEGFGPGLFWGWFGMSRVPRKPHESKISGDLDINVEPPDASTPRVGDE